MSRKLLLILLAMIVFFGAVLFFRAAVGTETLWRWSGNGTWLLPLVTVAALLDSINPCAFSILLVTVAFLFTLGQLRRRVLAVGGMYVLGIFVAYLLLGFGIFGALHLFNTPHFMAKIGAFLLFVLGLLSLGQALIPSFPITLGIPAAAHRKMAVWIEHASLPTAFLLGSLVGLCEFPCTGGPYLMVIGLLKDVSTRFRGALYLLYYNALFVLPLVLVLLFISNKSVVDRLQTWRRANMHTVHLVTGVLMLLLAGLILIL